MWVGNSYWIRLRLKISLVGRHSYLQLLWNDWNHDFNIMIWALDGMSTHILHNLKPHYWMSVPLQAFHISSPILWHQEYKIAITQHITNETCIFKNTRSKFSKRTTTHFRKRCIPIVDKGSMPTQCWGRFSAIRPQIFKNFEKPLLHEPRNTANVEGYLILFSVN